MPPRDEALAGELAEVRERMARVEMGADAHERASAERHATVLAAVADVRARLERAEERTWKVVIAVTVLAAGGGVGGAELVKSLLGG
jgi:hypothetical protein